MKDMKNNRALAALQGLALGDALGMPTQSMSPGEINEYYGAISGLTDSVAEQKIAPSMPAGSVTDDTEQALLLADLLVRGDGHVDPMSFAQALLAWETDMIARDSLDLLGPSTKLALEKVRQGEDPLTTGKTGTTNGAAMRVTPVGIAFDVRDTEAFANAVHESCMVTHDTTQGWEGAMLVAGAVSAGVNGLSTRQAILASIDLVASVPARGNWSAKASVVSRAQQAMRGVEGLHGAACLAYLRDVVGTSVESTESIPAALALANEFADSPMEGLLVAANLGGDTDTIAAMTGAILGATHGPQAFDPDAVTKVQHVSGVDLCPITNSLLSLRDRANRSK